VFFNLRTKIPRRIMEELNRKKSRVLVLGGRRIDKERLTLMKQIGSFLSLQKEKGF